MTAQKTKFLLLLNTVFQYGLNFDWLIKTEYFVIFPQAAP